MFGIPNIPSTEKMPTLDATTPYNVQLSAFYKRSFAYYTVKERLPVIVTKIIDYLSRERSAIMEEFGADCSDNIKDAIGYLSKLKNEIQTNKPFEPITEEDPEALRWNYFISQQPSPYYFTAVWLFTECYVYRRIREAFITTATLKLLDPFRDQKDTTFNLSMQAMCQVADHLVGMFTKPADNHQNLLTLLKVNLWSNKCDLSLSAGNEVSQSTNPITMVTTWQENVIIDHSEDIYIELDKIQKSIVAGENNTIIDIICDNAGYELFTDLCLADYLITCNFASRIRFRIKTIPWFVSDVTERDFLWTIQSLIAAQFSSESPEGGDPLTSTNLKILAGKWQGYVDSGQWTSIADSFWTTPLEFYKMKEEDVDLFKELNEAKMAIFKGDLNYRKLMAEVNWPPTTPFDVALKGFFPCPLVAVRTVKADLISGLPPGKMEELNAKDDKWMEKGDYGIIQFSPRKLILEHVIGEPKPNETVEA